MSNLNVRRFGIEFVLATGASAVGYDLGYRLLNDDSSWAMVGKAGAFGLFVALFLLYALPYGIAVLIFIGGLVTRRLGIILGPPAFWLGLILLSAGQTQQNESSLADATAAARALDQRAFLPHGSPGVIAVFGAGYCRGVCRTILAQTDSDFAINHSMPDESWTLYRRIEGDACLTEENRRSYLEFQADGYEGLCAESRPWKPSGDMLFVSALDNITDPAEKVFGPGFEGLEFHGFVFEAYDRRGGVNRRLLGRWIAGTLSAPRNKFNLMSDQDYVKIGKRFTPEEFFAALLDMPIKPD